MQSGSETPAASFWSRSFSERISRCATARTSAARWNGMKQTPTSSATTRSPGFTSKAFEDERRQTRQFQYANRVRLEFSEQAFGHRMN